MISVVSLAHNQRRYTELLLHSLGEPRCADADFELIFIDNASMDGTRDLVETFRLDANPHFHGLRYHAFQENRGVAEAINQGVSLATGEWILQADNDVVFGPGSFSILLNWIQKYPGGMISPNWPWIQKKLGTHGLRIESGLDQKAWQRLERLGLRAPLEAYRATGSCWMCSKTLFNRVGGWDPRFRNICASDDFIWKITAAGADLYTVPCPVYHRGEVTRKKLERSGEQELKDMTLFRQRWGGHPEDRTAYRRAQCLGGKVPPARPAGWWRRWFGPRPAKSA